MVQAGEAVLSPTSGTIREAGLSDFITQVQVQVQRYWGSGEVDTPEVEERQI